MAFNFYILHGSFYTKAIPPSTRTMTTFIFPSLMFLIPYMFFNSFDQRPDLQLQNPLLLHRMSSACKIHKWFPNSHKLKYKSCGLAPILHLISEVSPTPWPCTQSFCIWSVYPNCKLRDHASAKGPPSVKSTVALLPIMGPPNYLSKYSFTFSANSFL